MAISKFYFKKNFIISFLIWCVLAEIASPGHPYYILTFFLYIPLFYCLKNNSKNWFYISLIFGLVYNIIYFRWLIYPFQYSNIPLIFALLILLLFSTALSCFTVVFGYFFLNYRNPILISSVFVTLEIIKGVLFTGFPWGDLSYNFYKFRPFLNLAPYLGSYFISFIVIFFNILIFMFFFEKKYIMIVGIISILLIIAIFNNFKIQHNNSIEKNILIVQGNVPESIKMKPENAKFVIEKYIKLTLKAAKNFKPNLIIYPETIYTKFLNEDKNLKTFFTDFLKEINCPVIVGIPSIDFLNQKKYKIYNSLYLFYTPNNFFRYDKIHLVPFGEYTPLKAILSFVNKLVPGEDFSKGSLFKILKYQGFKIIPLICFEGIFPWQIRKFNMLGGNIIVNISNEAWFGDSFALYQHLAANVFRAVESKKFFIKAANTGISAVISPKGNIEKSLQPFKEGVIFSKVYLYQNTSFYHKYGYLINFLYIFISLSMLFNKVFRTERKDRAL